MSDTVVLTSYFTNKQHPQRIDPTIKGLNQAGFVDADNYDYIKPWYESLIKVGLDGVIMHDGLSDEFIEKHHNPLVTWVKVDGSDYTNNDYRFFCYLDYLTDQDTHPCVVLSDCCDVTIKKDPTILFEGNSIYFCEDTCKVKDYNFAGVSFHRVCSHLGLLETPDLQRFMDMEGSEPMLNMGVIGSNRDVMLNFLRVFTTVRREGGYHNFNANMVLGNVVAREYMGPDMITGYGHGRPFCSEYKKNQLDREDVYFVHK